MADEFLASGKDVVIYDSQYRGLESRIEYLRQKYNREIPLVVADIRDMNRFEGALSTFRPYGIIHTAALKAVGESIEKPDEYYEVNFHATTKMLEVVAKHQIKDFIFSSTAAVYGASDQLYPIQESSPKRPISPYGASKLAAESEVEKFLSESGNRGTSLRFFNVVGAAALELIDNSTENLVPIVINKIKAGESPVVYGVDYPTHDGSCIRDYVDVRDIAKGHLLAAVSNDKLPPAINLGTGNGSSVREVISQIFQASGERTLDVMESGRRVGDSAFLCADTSLARTSLGFIAEHDLSSSIRSIFQTS